MVEAVLERIPFAYGSLTIVASMLLFLVINCFLIHAFKKSNGSPQKSSSRSSSFEALGRNWKYRNIAVSWAHAVIVGIWNLIVMYYCFNELMEDIVEYYNVCIYILVCVSTGYFLYDFIDIVVNCPFSSSWEILVHHVVVSIAFLVNIVQCRFLGYNIVALLAEANSIFLHLRKLLQFFQVHSSHWSYCVVVFLNLFTFVSCRFLCIGWIAYGLYVHFEYFSTLHWLFLAPSTFIMSCINAVLFWRLILRDVLQSRIHRQHTLRSTSKSDSRKKLKNGQTLNNNGKKLNGVVGQSYEHDD